MKKTFQSFVFGCRVNEAERIQFDRRLREAGFTVDLASPSFSIINTCAITGKAEREAKQLIYSLRKKHPATKIVITGCSATYWKKRFPDYAELADILIPNDKKSLLVDELLLHLPPQLTDAVKQARTDQVFDKFMHSNRVLVKIQDGCHRFCSYCIVPYLRGSPQSLSIDEIVTYINSFSPLPSEVVLSAINTEAFGKDTGETLIDLIKAVLARTHVPRIGFGSIHPWSIDNAFLQFYKQTLSQEKRFIHFFHVPIQSGCQTTLDRMKRVYKLNDILTSLKEIKTIRPDAFLATDIIVGYLGESDTEFEQTFEALDQSPFNRFHVFPFSNRPHTAAYYLKKQMQEVSVQDKKKRAERLRALSDKKYTAFVRSLDGSEHYGLVISKMREGVRVLLDNNVDLTIDRTVGKDALPGSFIRVTMESFR